MLGSKPPSGAPNAGPASSTQPQSRAPDGASVPPVVPETSDSGAQGSNLDADQSWLGWRNKIWVSSLERFQAREEATWKLEPTEVQSLAWLLRMKHEEARVQGKNERRAASLLTMVGLLIAMMAACVAIGGWWTIMDVGIQRGGVPPGLWELGVATSAAVLLLGGAATGLFKAAHPYSLRARAHDEEMEWTRKVETAVRLSLVAKCGGLAPESREALKALGLQLLVEKKDSSASSPTESHSLSPEILNMLLEKAIGRTEAVVELIKNIKG